ncbi:DUF4037 domain-containing protein [Kineococcus sp. SYSU DK002]|uniref:DUF4037 domain-containing protein n=1 Tax=Kineococcus sp. SYSU DK002 TaxID=3383123 RepID=UPI003D7C90A0
MRPAPRRGAGGAALAAAFHREVLAPLLHRTFGDAPFVAGRFGSGSDVLGLDDDVSTDHDWGLRCTLLVDPGGPGPEEVRAVLDRDLPATFTTAAGTHPVRFATTWDPRPRHRVEVADLDGFVRSRLGVGPREGFSTAEWLSFTGQAVLELTAGPVFADPAGRWEEVRRALTWYPDDVWRYVVACAWRQLEQELPFVGRTATRGDDLGSRLLAARLAGTATHLGLLLDRVWAPYSKWTGTALAASPAGRALPHLHRALAADRWPEREAALCAALEDLLLRQREVGLPAPGPATAPFHDRPFRGVTEGLAEAVAAGLHGFPPLGVGAADQWSSAVDVLVRPGLRRSLREAS